MHHNFNLPVMHNVKTLLRADYKTLTGESAVILQVYIKGKRVALPTGVSVTEEDWDDVAKVVKKRHEKARDYNLIIEKSRATVNDIMVKYRLNNMTLTPHLMRVEYKNPTRDSKFVDWMRLEIKERKGVISTSTMVMHYSIASCLEKYNSNLQFSEMDVHFLDQFEKWLKVKEKNSVDTISKKMRCLRNYLNRAKRSNIIRDNPFDQFKIKKGKGRIIYLEDKEVKQMIGLYHREYCPRQMKKILKYFLFSCVTGLRLSDVKRIRQEDIINDTIYIIPKKKLNTDHEMVSIPLCSMAKDILDDVARYRVKGRIFDCYTDQVTNRYLKDVAKLLKIRKTITYHVSRHTFATLFLEKTDDLATLQKLMGHHSIAQTMVYAHVSETKKREQIKVFDQIF